MLNRIVEALKQRTDLAGWTVRHMLVRGTQVYAVPQGIESRRAVDGERFAIDVLRQTAGPDGTPGVGSGNVTLLPGGDVAGAIDQATLVAGLVSNPVHGLPAPGPLPDVPLVDADLQKDPAGVMQAVMDRMRAAAARNPAVQMNAAECFSELRATHLLNSRGIDAQQEETRIDVEFVLKARRGERETETFAEMTRRRVSDLDLESALEQGARHTLDLLEAGAPASRQGAVVLRDQALATFISVDPLIGGVLQTLGSASSKYAKLSNWEIEKSVFRGEVKGDPLTVWANRLMPFGTASNRFDEEGLPAQRLELIRDNELAARSAEAWPSPPASVMRTTWGSNRPGHSAAWSCPRARRRRPRCWPGPISRSSSSRGSTRTGSPATLQRRSGSAIWLKMESARHSRADSWWAITWTHWRTCAGARRPRSLEITWARRPRASTT